MGITTHIPCLLTTDGFDEWKFVFENYLKMKDVKACRSILRGPTVITCELDDEEKTVSPKPIEMYTHADIDKVEEDERALYTLTLALSPDIAQGFREVKSAKAIWEALIDVYEGNENKR